MPVEPAPNYPFTAFNFAVEIDRPGGGGVLCEASFAECDGLEMTMEVKTIREGGNNGQQIRLTGPLAFGQLTLKRGMTASFDLWDWFTAVLRDPSVRTDAHVVLFATDRTTPRARFRLSRCVPVKLKAPPLNAKDGMVAIEELQIAYESFEREPTGAGATGNTGTTR
jgi:phage tail-like protein